MLGRVPLRGGNLRVHREDYLAQVDDRKYLLDMHIKFGIKARDWHVCISAGTRNCKKLCWGISPATCPR
ncbi:MAG: hypothetical protein ACLSFT_10385 [Ruminococcus callidus]